jgi:hypothetical protein
VSERDLLYEAGHSRGQYRGGVALSQNQIGAFALESHVNPTYQPIIEIGQRLTQSHDVQSSSGWMSKKSRIGSARSRCWALNADFHGPGNNQTSAGCTTGFPEDFAAPSP